MKEVKTPRRFWPDKREIEVKPAEPLEWIPRPAEAPAFEEVTLSERAQAVLQNILDGGVSRAEAESQLRARQAEFGLTDAEIEEILRRIEG